MASLSSWVEELLQLSADADGQVPGSGTDVLDEDLLAWPGWLQLSLGEVFDLLAWLIATNLVDGKTTFNAADWLINGLESRWSDFDLPEGGHMFQRIYQSIDAGEFRHSGDDASVDSVTKYTLPQLRACLSAEPPSGLDRVQASH